MREHRYSFEIPHATARVWALFQDYDRWTDYAPMVKRVDVLWPGDEHHNGRLRRVIYKMPFGREGAALELVTDVEPERGYTFTMISREPGNDQTGTVRLEPIGPNRTRFSFERALPRHQGAVEVVRGPDLQVHQQEERGQHAARVAVAHRPPRVPFRSRRLDPVRSRTTVGRPPHRPRHRPVPGRRARHSPPPRRRRLRPLDRAAPAAHLLV